MLEQVLNGEIQRGVSPDIAAAHVIGKAEAVGKLLEEQLLRPSVSGPQIKRYNNWAIDQYIIYTSRATEIQKYPNVAKHLRTFRDRNTCREVKDGKHPWWSLHRPRDPEIFSSPKFIGLTTSKTIELIYDPKDSLVVSDSMYVLKTLPEVDPFAFMAILQSKLFQFLYQVANQGESRVIPQVKASKLYSLPFPKNNPENPLFEQLSRLCQELYLLNRQLAKSGTNIDVRALQQQIEYTEITLNRLVYELYGLTKREVDLVERKLAEVGYATH